MGRATMRRAIAISAFALWVIASPLEPPKAVADSSLWLPFTKTELIKRVAGPNTDSVHVETLDEMLVRLRADPTANPEALQLLATERIALAQNFAPDDTVWVVSGPTVGFPLAIAGRGDQLHSIRIVVPTVGHQSSEQGWREAEGLFKLAFPDTADVDALMAESLNAAWSKSPLMTGATPADRNDVIARKHIGGTTLAAFGVPPDLIVYIITVRDRCIPDANKVNPFQRLVC